jgi:hypothetical protein
MLSCILLAGCVGFAKGQSTKTLPGQAVKVGSPGGSQGNGNNNSVVLGNILKMLETNLLKQPEPVTTSFKNVDTTRSLGPEFGNDAIFQSLDSLDFGPCGYILKPGFFQADLAGFCIKAGTPAPAAGNGYMNAALQGPMAAIINHLVWNSLFNPHISQREIQVLLWAIIAKTRYSDFSTDLKRTANSLLSAKDLVQLSGGGIPIISKELFRQQIIQLPSVLHPILTAENNIRQLVASGSQDYDAIERWAIRAGIAAPQMIDTILKGRWTYMPAGYYVRYFPAGYKHTLVQVYMPDSTFSYAISKTGDSTASKQVAIHPCYDPTINVIQPGNNGAQRLITRPGYGVAWHRQFQCTMDLREPTLEEIMDDKKYRDYTHEISGKGICREGNAWRN